MGAKQTQRPRARNGLVNAVVDCLVEQAKQQGVIISVDTMRSRFSNYLRPASGETVSMALSKCIDHGRHHGKIQKLEAELARLKAELAKK